MDGPSFYWCKGSQQEREGVVLVPQAVTARNQDSCPDKKAQRHGSNRTERDDEGKVSDAKDCVTKAINQVEKRVEVRKLGPEWWQD